MLPRPFSAMALLFALPLLAKGAPALAADAAAADVDAQGATFEEEAPSEAAVGETSRPAYTLRIEGVSDKSLADLLQRGSQLAALAERPPASQAALLRRIEVDRDRFRAILRSEGYYAGSIDSAIDETTLPPTVVMRVDPGPRFVLKSFAVVAISEAAPIPLPGVNELGLTIGQPARAADVVAAQRRVVEILGEHAHPLAQLGEVEAIVDHADQTMRVTVPVDPGPVLGFGPVSILGLTRVEEDYVRLLIPWTEGAPYNRREVEQFRKKLIRTGLFSTVIISPATTADADGRLPIRVELAEADPRSVGGGFKYYTSEGPAGEVFWEHRNLWGRDEDLRLSAEVGRILQNLTVDVLVPNYQRVDQDLVGRTIVLRETTDAFDRTGIETHAQLRRVFNRVWAFGTGPSLETAWIEEDGRTNNATLLGLPSFSLRDSTDDRLNPSEGSKVRLAPTPYIGWYVDRQHFISNELSGSAYVSLDPGRRYVVAGRVKVGSILGEERDTIPADKRFYAGGGNSVRGYPFQKVGPLNEDHDPIGGRSLLELSAEFRARVWGNFGVVPFIDGGTAFTSVIPDFSETMRWGAGLGLRYYTAIGPVRLDFAVPINPRHDIDDPFQFYINLGQAF